MVSHARERSLRVLLTSQGFSHRAVETLCRIGNWQELTPGDVLMACGQPVGSLAVVEHGEMGVFSLLNAGRERLLLSLDEGDIAGWELFTSDSVSMFTLRARSHARLWRITPSELRSLAKQHPQIAAQLAGAALATMHRIRAAGKVLLLESCDLREHDA